MAMKICPWSLLLTLIFLNGCAVQPPTLNDSQVVIARGDARKFLAEMEAKATEAERGRDWALAARSYNVAARVALSSGQLQKAVSYSSKGLKLAERIKDIHLEVESIYFLAMVHRSLRQFEKAREWTEKGIAITIKLPPGAGKGTYEGHFYRLLGQDHLRKAEYQQAIESLTYSLQKLDSRLSFVARNEENLQSNRLHDSVHLVTGNLVALARAYERVGNVDEAIRAYQRGIHLIGHYQAKTYSEGRLYQGLGRIYLSQRDYPRALENLQRALALAESQQQLLAGSSARILIGDVLRRTGKLVEAIPFYQTAIQQTESARSLLQSQEYRQSFFEGGLAPYVSMIGVLLGSGRTEEAFSYSERARSRAFLDVLGNKIQLARSGTMLEHERALQARIGVLRAMMETEEADSSEKAGLRKDLAEADRDYNDYLSKIRKENTEQASLMTVEPLTLKQVQELLDPGVTMLEYFVVQDAVYLWVVEKDRAEFVSTSVARKDLVAKVTELRGAIYQLGEKERFSAPSRALHELLIQPVLPHIRGKELIVVPHDVLHYLPFQALLGSDRRYLIERYPIYYLSSASLMQFVQQKRRTGGQKILALGNPQSGDSTTAIQFARMEVEEIKNIYPQSTVLLEKAATEEKAKTLSPQYDILHFATHAELKENDPLASAILLAQEGKEDGRLEVREIFGMDLKASLVVLSACETGLGKLSSGDELVGLTRAFIYAGTPSVVASLWKVDDSSTAHLMSSFYRNLKTMTKVEALRQAQLAMIRGDGRSDLLARRGVGGIGKLGETPSSEPHAPSSISVTTSHPYFWAPFILVGEGK